MVQNNTIDLGGVDYNLLISSYRSKKKAKAKSTD